MKTIIKSLKEKWEAFLKNPYKRKLTGSIALNVFILLVLMQVVIFIIVGFYVTLLLGENSVDIQSSIAMQVFDELDEDAIRETMQTGEKTEAFKVMENDILSIVSNFSNSIGMACMFVLDGDVYRTVFCVRNSDLERENLLPLQEFNSVTDLVTPEEVRRILTTERAWGDKIKYYEVTRSLKQSPIPRVSGLEESSELWMFDLSGDDAPGSTVMFMRAGYMVLIEYIARFLVVYAICIVVFTMIVILQLTLRFRKRISLQVQKVCQASVDFMRQTKEIEDPTDWKYMAPEIKTRDEINELADTVVEMTDNFKEAVCDRMKITQEKQRIQAELDLARGIQAGALPRNFPERTSFVLHASMTPAKEVGGDFYDFFFVDEDHLALVIADVSGKGVPAALFMMSAKNQINSLFLRGLSPREVLRQANETILENNKEDMFVTVWAGLLTVSTGELVTANAGHEYPAVRRKDGQFEIIDDDHGFVIGELPGMTFNEHVIHLEPGDTIFVYTDGVPEANDPNEEMFGLERMLATLNEMPDAAPSELEGHMQQALSNFMNGVDPFDDVTMLCLKLLPG